MTERRKIPITIEDVQSAVMVLREFLQMQREAQLIIGQMSRGQGRSSGWQMPTMEDILDMVQKRQAAKESGESQSVPEMTEDDLGRIRGITEKRKVKTETPTAKT
jgi:hypothetical protein